MDPRCVPDKYFGPVYGGASVRNAGGRATDDAIASLMSLRAIGRLSTVAVVHHTGMKSPLLIRHLSTVFQFFPEKSKVVH